MSQLTTDLKILPVHWSESSVPLSTIRREVFIDEQHVPEDLEWDGEDEHARHWLASNDRDPIGTVRLLRNGHVGRMAVRKPWRQCGVGTALLQAVIDAARQLNLRELYLHAQTHALDFYARHGFIVEGPEFMDAGIPHRTMRLQLRAQRVLGQDHGRFAVKRPRDIALDLARQAQRHLRILSNELDPQIYDNADFATALSQLVRGYRRAEIRLLIADGSELSRGTHAVLNLQRRLNSAIKIRRIDAIVEPLRENYLVADGCGVLCLSVRESDLIWADYNNAPLARDYTRQFDELWNHAVEDPNLRQLNL